MLGYDYSLDSMFSFLGFIIIASYSVRSVNLNGWNSIQIISFMCFWHCPVDLLEIPHALWWSQYNLPSCELIHASLETAYKCQSTTKQSQDGNEYLPSVTSPPSITPSVKVKSIWWLLCWVEVLYTMQDRLDTLANVQAAGISMCAGGIIGLGEGPKDRVGLIHQLATLAVHPESVPINSLVAIAGTPMQDLKSPTGLDLARCIATARITMPKSVVRLSAGRLTLSTSDQVNLHHKFIRLFTTRLALLFTSIYALLLDRSITELFTTMWLNRSIFCNHSLFQYCSEIFQSVLTEDWSINIRHKAFNLCLLSLPRLSSNSPKDEMTAYHKHCSNVYHGMSR